MVTQSFGSGSVWVNIGTHIYFDVGVSPSDQISPTERWQTNNPVNDLVTSALAGTQLRQEYYHQFIVTFVYSDAGSDSSIINSGAQIGTYESFGTSTTITAGATLGTTSVVNTWVDAAYTGQQSATFTTCPPNPTNERWALSTDTNINLQADNGGATITNSGYYHQYKVSIAYLTTDTTSTPSSAVTLSGTQLGNTAFTEALTKTVQNIWLDAGSSWSVNSQILVSPTTEQWIATSGTSGTIGSSTMIAPQYNHQFYITVSNGGHGGSFAGSQWVNADNAYTTSVTSPTDITAGVSQWVTSQPTLSISSVTKRSNINLQLDRTILLDSFFTTWISNRCGLVQR